jgi:hypothetical protein
VNRRSGSKAFLQCKHGRCISLRARSRSPSVPSGWADTTSDGAGRVDRLHNLGKAQNYNINIDHGVDLPSDIEKCGLCQGNSCSAQKGRLMQTRRAISDTTRAILAAKYEDVSGNNTDEY